MNRYVVAFERAPVIYDLTARGRFEAVAEAAALDHNRAPFAEGGHLAHVLDGHHLHRFEIWSPFDRGARLSDVTVESDPGPIPAQLARLMLDTWGPST